MHPPNPIRFAVFLLLVVTAACSAQNGFLTVPAGVQGHARAQLIADLTSVNPGGTVRIGVLLKVDPGWHVYWANPGQSGLATTVTWKLPQGWSAGPLLWPRPERFETGGLVTYGYSGDVLLAADFTAPAGLAPGSSAAIGARTSWLACEVECTPGSADVALSLPVGTGRPARDSRWAAAFDRERSLLPAADPSLRFEAVRSGPIVTLLAHG